MLSITQKYDEDIQDATYGHYKLVQLTINNEVVFSTADSDTLSRIAADKSGEGSWLIDADKNSQELGEFNQLRISKVGDVLKLEVQKNSNKEFEMIADIAIGEFAAAVQRFIYPDDGTPCRVCGLMWPASDREEILWNICVCCGVEAGYEDTLLAAVRRYRQRWITDGANWFVGKSRPADWSLEAQMASVPAEWR